MLSREDIYGWILAMDVVKHLGLNHFRLKDHASRIQLTEEDHERFDRATDEITQVLQSENASFPWTIQRVFRSGSLERGTAVRGHVDVDLVCFLEKNDRLKTLDDFVRLRKDVLCDIAAEFADYFKWGVEHK